MIDRTQNTWKTPSPMPPADSKSDISTEAMRTELAKRSQLGKRKAAESIIADPSIPAAKRVKLVSSELRNIVEYPHSNNVHARPLTAKCWTETFRCDCSKRRVIVSSVPQPPPPSPSPTSTTPPSPQPEICNASAPAGAKPLKRTQSSLSHWVAGVSKKHKPDTAPVGAPPQTNGKQGQSGVLGCGGYVQITVEEEAHPLCSYIKGQMITVLVERPTQMAPVK
ncbi:uncharacterized protein LAESUDRAFT_810404 [Laetiporus sulphureus 93-53]|uniref:Uncharacterized protein n=1 Tax=Laetiporus sulphureus 93-53 TaxID=1314785 RepID=A0A165GBZ6_9APHY|nr:uncharacterized protein LAESUDRAFT_810404 [Laetiporus sulphureus 93-53]KZT10134.1 hypothetical protein LAESUDRAFT_810404 [Laetiporus sulphureus 93-53]